MLDPRIILSGQEQADPFETAAKGIQFGQGLRQLLSGRQAGKMAALNPNERQAFADKSMFSRELNAQLRADKAAEVQALREQQKHDADIYNTLAQGGERIANAGKTTQETGANRYGLGRDVWMAVTQSGNPNAGKMLLNRHLASGAIDQPTYDALNSQLTALEGQEPSVIQSTAFNQAKSTLDPKYNFATVDAQEANVTSMANNQNTVNATLAGQQVQKEIADANRASNDAYRMQQLRMQQNKGQIVNAADGKSYIYYPNLNKYEPMLDQSGQHASKTSDQKAVNEENKRIQRVETLTPEIRKLLGSGSATGSFIGAGADWLGRTIGYSTEGSETTAQLKTLSGQLVALMPRMEGPQSNIDVEMYKEMAGNVADPTLPVKTRLAALSSIEGLNEKYKKLNQGVQTPQEHKGVPYASAGQATTSYNGANVSLSEVKQAAKQAGISTEQMVSILKGQGVSIK